MYEYQAVIRSVYDGDTCRADIDLGFGVWIANQPLRLNGIDAPEMSTPEGKVARAYLVSLMPVGSKVVIRTYKDAKEKYGRWLAEISRWDDWEWHSPSVNQLMVTAGHAKPYDGGKR